MPNTAKKKVAKKRKPSAKAMLKKLVPKNAVVWVPGAPRTRGFEKLVDNLLEEKLMDYDRAMNEQLKGKLGGWAGNVTELLYAVVGYLSTRKAPLIFSEKHNAAPIAQVMGEIVKALGLPETTKDWPKIPVPPGIDHITNDEHVVKILSAEEVYINIMPLISGLLYEDQNRVLATLINELKGRRSNSLTAVNQMIEREKSEAAHLEDQVNRLSGIFSGYTVLVEPLRIGLTAKGDDNG